METYGVAPKPPTDPVASSSATTAIAPTPAAAAAAPKETEEDDLGVPVPEGAGCKRLGCRATWEGEAVSRGQGEKAECKYHPQAVSCDRLVVSPILGGATLDSTEVETDDSLYSMKGRKATCAVNAAS